MLCSQAVLKPQRANTRELIKMLPHQQPTSASNSILPTSYAEDSEAQQWSQIRYVNTGSKFLSNDENSMLFRMLGDRCTTIATTICKLCFADKGVWLPQCTGALCFVRDANRRSFFLRFYDLTRRKLIFEQEIYQGMVYDTQITFFHQFEADDRVVGFAFTENDIGRAESERLADHLIYQVERMGIRIEPPESPAPSASPGSTRSTTPSPSASKSAPNKSPSGKSSSKSGKSDKKGSQDADNAKQKTGTRLRAFFRRHKPGHKKDKTADGAGTSRKIRPEDISGPTNFRHVLHVGYNDAGRSGAEHEIDIAKDPAVMFLFGKLGYDMNKTTKTRYGQEQVAKVVDSIGGMEQVYRLAQAQGYEPPTPSSPMSSYLPSGPSVNPNLSYRLGAGSSYTAKGPAPPASYSPGEMTPMRPAGIGSRISQSDTPPATPSPSPQSNSKQPTGYIPPAPPPPPPPNVPPPVKFGKNAAPAGKIPPAPPPPPPPNIPPPVKFGKNAAPAGKIPPAPPPPPPPPGPPPPPPPNGGGPRLPPGAKSVLPVGNFTDELMQGQAKLRKVVPNESSESSEQRRRPAGGQEMFDNNGSLMAEIGAKFGNLRKTGKSIGREDAASAPATLGEGNDNDEQQTGAQAALKAFGVKLRSGKESRSPSPADKAVADKHQQDPIVVLKAAMSKIRQANEDETDSDEEDESEWDD